jgi:hypothetical protein
LPDLESYAPDAGGAPFSLARENAAPSSLIQIPEASSGPRKEVVPVRREQKKHQHDSPAKVSQWKNTVQ